MGRDRSEIRYRLPLGRSRRGKPRGIAEGPQELPRITRLLALAIQLDGMPGRETTASYAEWARLGHISRSRLSQILNLRLLAPDIQEWLLFLRPVTKGREPIHERSLRAVAQCDDWAERRRMLEQIFGHAAGRSGDGRKSSTVLTLRLTTTPTLPREAHSAPLLPYLLKAAAILAQYRDPIRGSITSP